LIDQMILRTGPLRKGSEKPRIARLQGYEVVFNLLGGDGEIYANIAQSSDIVIGMLYRCGSDAMAMLDRYEAGYDRVEVSVFDEEGNELEAIAYIARSDCIAPQGQPSDAYLQKILQGARSHSLPIEYIQSIESRARGGNGIEV